MKINTQAEYCYVFDRIKVKSCSNKQENVHITSYLASIFISHNFQLAFSRLCRCFTSLKKFHFYILYYKNSIIVVFLSIFLPL